MRSPTCPQLTLPSKEVRESIVRIPFKLLQGRWTIWTAKPQQGGWCQIMWFDLFNLFCNCYFLSLALCSDPSEYYSLPNPVCRFSPVLHQLTLSSLSQCTLWSSFPPRSSIFTLVTLLIPFYGVWLRFCEWVRMAVSRSNPQGLVLIFAPVFWSVPFYSKTPVAKIKLLAGTSDETPPSATETYCTPCPSTFIAGRHSLQEFTCTAALEMNGLTHGSA